jgi:hypothetical protein
VDDVALTVLLVNTAQTDEHYGNMVIYLRLKGIVPRAAKDALTRERCRGKPNTDVASSRVGIRKTGKRLNRRKKKPDLLRLRPKPVNDMRRPTFASPRGSLSPEKKPMRPLQNEILLGQL